MPDKERLLGLLKTDSISLPIRTLSPSSPILSEEKVLEQAYTKLFAYLGGLQQQYDTKIIIVHHPLTFITPDKGVKFLDEDIKPLFSQLCEKHSICFIDTIDSFYDMYNSQYKLPHGFVTGEIGAGHLNANGHAVIADNLYTTIMQLCEDGKL